MDELVFSVTELNTYVQRSLQSDPVLRRLRVRGEVSNFKKYPSGHCYFTLKDERCRISCVWFASSQRGKSLAFMKDGARIQALGSAGLYNRDGQYQFVVEEAFAEGVGLWHMQLREVIDRLRAEGLLDPARKRPLPDYPSCIGVITSAKGAAVRDIIRVSRRRMPGVHIVIYPVQVQGDDAPEQVVEALRYFSTNPIADVVIVGRGGGSIEDLWAFNEEKVARAVAACTVPVISAVGHETDIALTDLVADERAATPSMAAEMAVPDGQALRMRLRDTRQALDMALSHRMERAELELLRRRRRLSAASPEQFMTRSESRLQTARMRLEMGILSRMDRENARIHRAKTALSALSPLRVLDRGYAIARLEDGRTLRKFGDISVGDAFTLYYAGGTLRARVTEQTEEQHEKE